LEKKLVGKILLRILLICGIESLIKMKEGASKFREKDKIDLIFLKRVKNEKR